MNIEQSSVRSSASRTVQCDSLGSVYTLANGKGIEEAVTGWLSLMLRQHRISTSEWGKRDHKTFRHLVNEIVNQEAYLVDHDGILYRMCSALRIDVRYNAPDGRAYQLYEAEQRFTDGRYRIRGSDFAVWEKLKQGEDTEAGIYRALKEELNIDDHRLVVIPGARQTLHRPDQDFPGIPSQLITHDYTVCISADNYRREYREVQSDKTTVFRWRLAQNPIVSRHSKGSRSYGVCQND